MRPEDTEDTDVDEVDANGAPAGETRALVKILPVSEPPERIAGYRNAPFVAQLVATKDQHPQTRERRRAEPDVVLAAYRATVALTTASTPARNRLYATPSRQSARRDPNLF
jgi:hypothetical protein